MLDEHVSHVIQSQNSTEMDSPSEQFTTMWLNGFDGCDDDNGEQKCRNI